jgi:NhaA family Na+:H+ antiporter
LLGIGLWIAMLKSGVHATIAGVLSAMCIPARTLLDEANFVSVSRRLLDAFGAPAESSETGIDNDRKRGIVRTLEVACEAAETPLQRLELMMHPWMAFAIMPVFALANAGVAIGANFAATLMEPLALGITVGLVAGKQIGLTLFSWLAVRAGWAALPQGVTWHHIYGAAWLAGIGFTMSIFIATLAFDGTSLDEAKTAILAASLLAGVGGSLYLSRLKAQPG